MRGRGEGAERATGLAAVLVLLAGLGTAVLRQPVPAPVPVAAPRVTLPTAPPPAPARTPTPKPTRAAGGNGLGPPPGPQYDPAPARTAPPAQRFALLVGVTDYQSPTVDTIAGAQDAYEIQRMLVEAGWLPENVRVLTDGQVTGQALRSNLAWLAERGRPGTFSFFHYSGHVKQFGGGTEALWPVDRDFVRDRELTRRLSAVSGRLWVDIAACEAASFSPGLPSDRVLVTASSKGTEKSYEQPAWGRSVWSGLLFSIGTDQRQADADRNGRVTMGEAVRYATYYSQLVTLKQRPYGRQTPQSAGDPIRGWTLSDPPA